MVLPMSRPQKNARSNVYYFRQRVPADLVEIFGRNEVSRSLGTKDPAEAKSRYAEEARKQELVWKSLRAKPEPLPLSLIMTLVGEYRRSLDGMVEDEPGEPTIWNALLALGDKVDLSDRARENWYGSQAYLN